jgi:hypothetical protein
LLVLVALSMSVSGNGLTPPPPYYEDTIDLVFPNFPLNGLLLVVMYILFVLMDGLPRPVGMLHHLVTFILAVAVITFSGALIDTVAFLEDDPRVYLAAALLIACICTGVAYRYLEISLSHSLLTGGAFFCYNIIAWAMIEEWYANLMDYVIVFSLLYVLLIIILVFEGFFFHYRIEADLNTDAYGDDGTPSGSASESSIVEWVRRYRLEIEALAFSIILCGMCLYVSFHPIFRWREYEPLGMSIFFLICLVGTVYSSTICPSPRHVPPPPQPS